MNRRTSVRAWLAVASLLTAWGGASELGAQRVWRSSFYPFVSYGTMDGLWGAGRFRLSSPVGFDKRPEPYAAALTFDAGASTQGSYAFVADAQAPALWAGWRVGLTLAASRENRLGFYGLGNATTYAAESVMAATYFYRVSRSRHTARATLQRRIAGPLRVLVGATIARADFRALPGPSTFRQYLASGAVDSTLIPFTDKVARAGLVLDTRDNEFDPHAGVVIEALFASGTGYTRTTAGVRLYAHPIGPVVFAARLAGEGTGGNPPFPAEIEMESSERPFVAVGGYHSLRGFHTARFIGPGKLLGGVEARWAPVRAPSVFELMLVGFYDTGRVFGPGEPFRVTTAGLHQSGGGEVAVRFLRNALLVLGAGTGSDGTLIVFGTQWSY